MDPHSLWLPVRCRRGKPGGQAVVETTMAAAAAVVVSLARARQSQAKAFPDPAGSLV